MKMLKKLSRMDKYMTVHQNLRIAFYVTTDILLVCLQIHVGAWTSVT